jgi:hypothetical protein
MASGWLRPVTIYEFQTGQMQGILRGAGPRPGVELTNISDGQPLTPPYHSLLTLTHYLSRAVMDPDAALNNPDRTSEMCGEILMVKYPPSMHWPLETTVSYALSREGCVDAGFHFHFHHDLPSFEAQVVSSLCEANAASYVHLEGEWFCPGLREKEMCFFARDNDAARAVEDGRWDFYLSRGWRVMLDERGYDYPMLVHLDQNGWALVLMLMTEECPVITLGAGPRQHNFSLVGRDIQAGAEITCHARLAYDQFESMKSILPLYHQFVRDVRSGEFVIPR